MNTIRTTIFLSLFLSPTSLLFSQDTRSSLVIGWWNVENLFDTVNDPDPNPEFGSDDEFTPNGKKEWTEERYQQKLKNLATVIRMIKVEWGLDILGVCEVEHKHVLEDLLRDYLSDLHLRVVYHESPDSRGIDVAFLYDTTTVTSLQTGYRTVPMPSRPTRDIIFAEFSSAYGPFVVIGNHWPSRSGGEEESRPNRIRAAQTCRALVDSILENSGSARIVLVGDFNDTPVDVSVTQYLRATGDRTAISDDPFQLYNCMTTIHGDSVGSYNYRGKWEMIDQGMVSSTLMNGPQLYFSSAEVFRRDMLLEPSGPYAGSPLRTYGGNKYLGGYSDHLAIVLRFAGRK